VDHRMGCLRIHFITVRPFQVQYISSKFDDGTLHSETNAKEWGLMFADVAYSCQLTLQATLTKPRSNQYTAYAFQFFFDVVLRDTFGGDILDTHFAFIDCARMNKGFADGLVCIR